MDNKPNDMNRRPYARPSMDARHERQNNSSNYAMERRGRRNLPFALVIAIDVLVAALLFCTFALFYVVLEIDEGEDAVVLPVPSAVVSVEPSPSKTPQETNFKPPEEPEEPQDTSMFGSKFPDKFTDGNVEKTENSYKSANINFSIKQVQKDGVTYFVADIYLKDIKHLKTALSKEKLVKNMRGDTVEMAQKNNAILATNGDFCSKNEGVVVRNGVLLRDKEYKDVAVLYRDGTMKTFSEKEFDLDVEKDKGLYQVWTFGPMLLQDGKAMEKFNTSDYLRGNHPRTAIGYYEPGHYCLVIVDGRRNGWSKGYDLKELSLMFEGLGCQAAFNLDGGQSSEMLYDGKVVNKPFNGGRDTSDIIYISEE